MLRILLLVILTHLSFAQSQEYRLLFSHVVYRHGHRAPSSTFPNDKYQEDAWPMGWGHLTDAVCLFIVALENRFQKGVRQLYDLGKYLRQRYSNFLSSNFSRQEFYIRSSDRDRALESAQSCIAGLYQPRTITDCNAWIDWRPIPIHAMAKKNDYLLQTDADSICPAYQDAYKKQSSDYIEQINTQYADLFAYLKEHSGMKEVDFTNADVIYGSVSREKEEGWPVPDWVDRVWNASTGETILGILEDLKLKERILEYDSPEKTKYMSGFLTGDIINRMKEKAEGKLKMPSKMVMYSAHEGTVMGLLFALDIFNNRAVPYAGCLIIELHESASRPGQHFVTVHYRNDSSKDPYPMMLPGCRSSAVSDIYCPLDVFEQSVQHLILYPESKLEQACRMDKCGYGSGSAPLGRSFLVVILHLLAAMIWKRV